MNLRHLGDAFDHWKGTMLEITCPKGARIVPMFTDENRWNRKQLEAYARLLRVSSKDVLHSETRFSNGSRGTYFDIPESGDLFLDPDVGICTNARPKKEHIAPSEIAAILLVSRPRILLIYQNKWQRKTMRETLNMVLSTERLEKFYRFGFDAGQVGIIFISCDRKRIVKAMERVQSWLGPVAPNRIIHQSMRVAVV